MAEEVSPEMKLNVANYFIKNISINEVKYALEDIVTVIDDPNVFNTSVQSKMLHDYNVSQMVHIQTPTNKRILLTPYNEVTANSFYDPETYEVFEVNHIEKTITGAAGTTKIAGDAAFRTAIGTGLTKYVNANYKPHKCVYGVFHGDSNETVICVSAVNTNLGAFWTGNWRATYKVTPGSNKLQAKLEINVHYFEDGNVQLNATYSPTTAIIIDASKPESIVDAISTIETDWQANLEKMYIDMHTNTFKAMRRALPITKTLFNWDSQAHALARELNN